MNAYCSKMNFYGSTSALWFRVKARVPKADHNTIRSGIGAIHEYIIDGKLYLLVTSLKDFDVVRCPDKTYAKVDRKTKTLIGAY